MGFEIPTLAASLAAALPGVEIAVARGCDAEGDDRAGFTEAEDAVRAADVAIVAVGDRAGLFGRGTVGEGNDVESLELPGVQRELIERMIATGTPVVLVVLSGRPYAIDWALTGEGAAAAALQAFFPGEEGGPALAAILTGEVSPSGHLPVSLPRSAGAQPYSYLHPILGGRTDITSADSTPALPFGHGLSYTSFVHEGLTVAAPVSAGGTFTAAVRVRNTGDRRGADVVQLYARDVHASVTRPVAQLLGFARVELEPGAHATVSLTVPTARLSFTGREGARVVEPGTIELWVGPSCAERETETEIEIVGEVHRVTSADARLVSVAVER